MSAASIIMARVEDADGPNQILREGARRRMVVLDSILVSDSIW